jgi:hypothetical protein
VGGGVISGRDILATKINAILCVFLVYKRKENAKLKLNIQLKVFRQA